MHNIKIITVLLISILLIGCGMDSKNNVAETITDSDKEVSSYLEEFNYDVNPYGFYIYEKDDAPLENMKYMAFIIGQNESYQIYQYTEDNTNFRVSSAMLEKDGPFYNFTFDGWADFRPCRMHFMDDNIVRLTMLDELSMSWEFKKVDQDDFEIFVSEHFPADERIDVAIQAAGLSDVDNGDSSDSKTGLMSLSEYLKSDETIWYVLGTDANDNTSVNSNIHVLGIMIVKADGTLEEVRTRDSDFGTLGDLAKLSTAEIKTIATDYKSDFDNYRMTNVMTDSVCDKIKKYMNEDQHYKLGIFTDGSGNNVDYEMLYYQPTTVEILGYPDFYDSGFTTGSFTFDYGAVPQEYAVKNVTTKEYDQVGNLVVLWPTNTSIGAIVSLCSDNIHIIMDSMDAGLPVDAANLPYEENVVVSDNVELTSDTYFKWSTFPRK